MTGTTSHRSMQESGGASAHSRGLAVNEDAMSYAKSPSHRSTTPVRSSTRGEDGALEQKQRSRAGTENGMTGTTSHRSMQESGGASAHSRGLAANEDAMSYAKSPSQRSTTPVRSSTRAEANSGRVSSAVADDPSSYKVGTSQAEGEGSRHSLAPPRASGAVEASNGRLSSPGSPDTNGYRGSASQVSNGRSSYAPGNDMASEAYKSSRAGESIRDVNGHQVSNGRSSYAPGNDVASPGSPNSPSYKSSRVADSVRDVNGHQASLGRQSAAPGSDPSEQKSRVSERGNERTPTMSGRDFDAGGRHGASINGGYEDHSANGGSMRQTQYTQLAEEEFHRRQQEKRLHDEREAVHRAELAKIRAEREVQNEFEEEQRRLEEEQQRVKQKHKEQMAKRMAELEEEALSKHKAEVSERERREHEAFQAEQERRREQKRRAEEERMRRVGKAKGIIKEAIALYQREIRAMEEMWDVSHKCDGLLHQTEDLHLNSRSSRTLYDAVIKLRDAAKPLDQVQKLKDEVKTLEGLLEKEDF